MSKPVFHHAHLAERRKRGLALRGEHPPARGEAARWGADHSQRPFGSVPRHHRDASKAGEEAAKQAKEALKGKTADVVLVFDCVEDKEAMLDAVARHFESKRIYGCSAYNAITQVSPSGTVGVLALAGVQVDAALSTLDGGHEACPPPSPLSAPLNSAPKDPTQKANS